MTPPRNEPSARPIAEISRGSRFTRHAAGFNNNWVQMAIAIEEILHILRQRGIEPDEELEGADLPGIGQVEEGETIYSTSVAEVFAERRDISTMRSSPMVICRPDFLGTDTRRASAEPSMRAGLTAQEPVQPATDRRSGRTRVDRRALGASAPPRSCDPGVSGLCPCGAAPRIVYMHSKKPLPCWISHSPPTCPVEACGARMPEVSSSAITRSTPLRAR